MYIFHNYNMDEYILIYISTDPIGPTFYGRGSQPAPNVVSAIKDQVKLLCIVLLPSRFVRCDHALLLSDTLV
jgi:hypothetical protein